ncbi:MAG: T9SS sorting signal type C domain-containing protein [Algicola sp.]|nr:T9SS sorting signal type C domain-containing protein [Algicola sp.]
MKKNKHVCTPKRLNLLFILSFYFIVLSVQTLTGQTVLIDPTGDGGFESGSTFAANGWTNNSTQTNQWVCNTGATAGFSGTNAAYISNNPTSTPPPHTYTVNSISVSHIYRDVSMPAGESLIQLSFDWICIGESSFDYMRVWLVPTTFTPSSGTQVTTASGRIRIGQTNYNSQSSWANETLTIPSTYAGTTFRLVFEWRNDSSVGTNPPAGLDNIELISETFNDVCSNAIALPCGTNNLSGTTIGAISSSHNTGCTVGSNGVWYTFVGDGDQTTITTDAASGFDHEMAIVSGSCGALTNIGCRDSSGTGGIETYTFTTTPGTTYYIYVAHYSSSTTGNFTISRSCVSVTPPDNDDCSDAFTVTPNADLSCTNTTSGTVNFASDSGVDDCLGASDDDVWFKFTATNTYHNIDLLNVSGVTDMIHALYGPIDDTNCTTEINTSNLLYCSDPNSSVINGLIIGETYYLQVYSYSSSAQTTTFDVCVGTPPPPPVNDEPCNAISLTVDPGGNCITSSGTTAYATDSGIVNSSCNTGGDNDDIWYSFVATSAFHNIQINNTGGSVDTYHVVYEGTCNGTLNSISCSDDNDGSTISALTIGNTYYIQIFTYSSSVGTSSSFDICTVALEDPCDNITPLSCDTPVNVSLSAGNGTLESNDCGGWGVGGQEALYSFTATITGDYSITQFSANTSGNGDGSDNHVNYYVKEASLGCDDNNWVCIDHLSQSSSSISPYPTADFTLTAGVTYYIRLDTESAESNDVNFQLNCPLPPPPPPGCGLNFYDSGGASSDYGNNENETITICPDVPGSSVTVEFLSFLVEGQATNLCYDNLRIYDGPDATAPQITPASLGLGIGTDGFCWQSASDGTADLTGQSITSTSPTGCLTFVFTSDGSLGLAGWEAEVTCCIVWEGSANTDWNTATNWSSGTIPTIDDCIVIPDATTTPNDPILDYTDPNDRGAGLNLTVQNNAYLELNHDTELTIKEWVDVQGNAVFNIKNNASLIQIDETNLNAGSIHVQRAPNTNFSGVSGLEYVYWSSPVSGFDITNVSPGTNTGLIFEWDPTVAGFGTGNHGYWYNASGAMVEGQGYIIRGLSGTPNSIANTLSWNPSIPVTANTALFSGAPHNGTLTVDVFHGGYDVAGDPGYQGNSSLGTLAYNDDDNWNLIGNPYPSAISADAFAAYNTNISGTVYLWQHAALPNQTTDPFYEDYTYNYDSSNYVEYNSSGSVPPGIDDLHIASGQGFFVTVNHSAPLSSSVTFTNSMRQYSSAYNNNTFFRVSDANAIRATATESTNMSQPIERHRVWLNLSNSNNMANTLLIGYIEGATNEFDRLYDGIEVKSTDLSFYSINNDFKCSIQGRALPFNTDDAIPLGMYLPQNDTYSIAINTLDGLFTDSAQNIYLEDTYLNIVHNLKESPYNFTADLGALNDRFILRYNAFGALHTNDVMAVENVTIIAPNNQFIKVNSGTQPIKTVTVYDLLGRPLISKDQISSHSITINHSFSDGTYIVIAVLESGLKKTKKVVLKH